MADEIAQIEKDVKKAFSKYWMIASIALAALLIIVLVYTQTSGISKSAAGKAILDFANAQGVNASIVKVTDQGSLYEVLVLIDGQEVPVYITNDGKYFVANPVSLTPEEDAAPAEDTEPAQTNVPKSDKPAVELYVMSYCPYGTQAEKGIIPIANLLKDKIDFKLKFVDYAMHPTQGEVQENTRQYCIQKEQPTKFISYLSCFLKEGKSDACLTETGIDKAKLDSCYVAADKEFSITENLNNKSKWVSGQFPPYLVDAEDNTKYGVRGSPTFIINGQQVSSARDSASLLNVVCAAFNTAPEECQQTLSSAAPSPGFGFEAAGANTDAQCG